MLCLWLQSRQHLLHRAHRRTCTLGHPSHSAKDNQRKEQQQCLRSRGKEHGWTAPPLAHHWLGATCRSHEVLSFFIRPALVHRSHGYQTSEDGQALPLRSPLLQPAVLCSSDEGTVSCPGKHRWVSLSCGTERLPSGQGWALKIIAMLLQTIMRQINKSSRHQKLSKS